MSDRKGVEKMNNEKFNASGCKDLTAYEALENIESEKRLRKLLPQIFRLGEKSGFHLEGRSVLRDVKTGKVWRQIYEKCK